MKWAAGRGRGGNAGGKVKDWAPEVSGEGGAAQGLPGVICSLSSVYMEPLGHYLQLLTLLAKLQLMHHLTLIKGSQMMKSPKAQTF